jgi:hypothetical protein
MSPTVRPDSSRASTARAGDRNGVYWTGLKGLVVGMAASLLLTSALLGTASGQRTQQQKQGSGYMNTDEKIPTAQ